MHGCRRAFTVTREKQSRDRRRAADSWRTEGPWLRSEEDARSASLAATLRQASPADRGTHLVGWLSRDLVAAALRGTTDRAFAREPIGPMPSLNVYPWFPRCSGEAICMRRSGNTISGSSVLFFTCLGGKLSR